MRSLVPLAVLTILAAAAHAQNVDPLTVTLPSGKTIHFQNDEQKARYDAAVQKRVTSPTAAPTPGATPLKPHLPDIRPTDKADGTTPAARVNISAPAFTADYYSVTPAGWVGRNITLSVAYFSSTGDGPNKKDGLQRLTAQTYNSAPGSVGGQSFGGEITVVAAPEAAAKLIVQCGTRYQYQSYGWLKTTLIKGEFRQLDTRGKDANDLKHFGLYVGD